MGKWGKSENVESQGVEDDNALLIIDLLLNEKSTNQPINQLTN
ncbi:MAG: hypothetical protein ABIX01_13815 [Chitinophagaceae bacterium]